MAGGIRHFIWDMGRGFEKPQRMGLAKATLAFSLTTTILIWVVAYAVR
jgi:succinate dehydrogenase / fumarate reductase cytochrome b subunit